MKALRSKITSTVGSPKKALGTRPAGPPVPAPGPRAPAGPPPAPGGGMVNDDMPDPGSPMPLANTPPVARVYGGATDGMGGGQGGMAIHPSAKAAKIGSYEPRHTSKHR